MAFNWTCPYCNRPQTVTNANWGNGQFPFSMSDPDIGPIGLSATAIVCANPGCKRPSVTAYLVRADRYQSGQLFIPKDEPPLHTFPLIPHGAAKPQPDFIPFPIREDYYEACRIRDLSPKSAATLARRCLQGMIRDFCGVSEGTLAKEIERVRSLVTSNTAPQGVSMESVEAIAHVRGVGNIGAHMEKDINVIVPVEPEEAQMLIELIESLFEEWYVARDKRASRFSGIKAIAEGKKLLIADQKKNAGST